MSERASCLASSALVIKEPLPHFTSTTTPSAPAASLRLSVPAVINGMEGIAPIFFRRSKRIDSTGEISSCRSANAHPSLRTWSVKSSKSISVLTFGIAFNFSVVEVKCSSSSPFIMGMATPEAAANGPRTKVVLSPTPPVEYFSILGRETSIISITSPESIISSVKLAIS